MRQFPSISFAVALAAFTLPFATVSCNEIRVEPSGADFVLRADPETEGANPDRLEIGRLVTSYGGGLATAAFLAFTLALIAAARRWGDGWVLLGGVAGLLALLFLKTRGGGAAGGTISIDVRAGAWLSAGAGATGALSAGIAWIRSSRPALTPFLPLLGAMLLLVGYLLPADRSAVVSSAYADSLSVREPWFSLFWLLPVAMGIAVLARRRSVPADLSIVALGVLAPTSIVVGQEIWRLWRDDGVQPGAAPFVFLAGIVLSAWSARSRRARVGRPAAASPGPAQVRAQAPPSGP